MAYDKEEIAKVYRAYDRMNRATGAVASGQRATLLLLLMRVTEEKDADRARAVGRRAAGFKTGRGGDLPRLLRPDGKAETSGPVGYLAPLGVRSMTTNNVGRGRGTR